MSIIARLNDDQRWFRGAVALRIDRMTDVHRTNILRSLVERAEENQSKYLAEILGASGPVIFDTGYATLDELLVDVESKSPVEWTLAQKLPQRLLELGATLAPAAPAVSPVAFLYDNSRWVTRDGKVYRPSKMVPKHRRNALRMLTGAALHYREQELIFLADQEPDEHREAAARRLRDDLESLTHQAAVTWLMRLPLPRRLAQLSR
ncbi:hypothetical protein [Leifsonia sp. EB34]|uniref:hypothetical protein n=1 Tax=Leifsonia sp. EB34 TaxID=3156303 RepID=UPI003517E198